MVEAGLDDGDVDGLLGDSPVEVDSLGLVISNTSGYITPLDRDGNGVYDFLEEEFFCNYTNKPVKRINYRDREMQGMRYSIVLMVQCYFSGKCLKMKV